MKQLVNWFRRKNLDDGLDRELRYHLDRRTDDLMQTGLPEWEARRQAKLEVGGVTQVREEVRDVWLTRWLRDFVGDLRFSGRFGGVLRLRLRWCCRSPWELERRRRSIRSSIRCCCTRFPCVNPSALC